MIEKVRQFIEKQHMIEAGDRILAGVSGGADSVCMLFVLSKLRELLDFELQVIHIEHGIRGEESRRDMRFVEELCKREGIACRTFAVDVPAKAKELGMTTEEAARTLRYEIMNREAEKWDKTHPLEQIRWTAEKNRNCNTHYVNVVKALKWWRKTQYPDMKHPKSYPLEHFIGDCCPDGITSVAEGVV